MHISSHASPVGGWESRQYAERVPPGEAAGECTTGEHMERGRRSRVTGAVGVLAAAGLGWTLLVPTPAPAAPTTPPVPAASASPSPSAAAQAAPPAVPEPSPVYPTATEAAGLGPEPEPSPYDREGLNRGNYLAADGRVIPALGTLTESIDQAILWELEPRVDDRHLINVARSLPLDGRKIMLTVDRADAGADRAAMTEDAIATADALVTEVRRGMPLESWTPGSDERPRLDPGWVMLTVMLPAEGSGENPVTALELGQGVEPKGPESIAVIESAGHRMLGGEDLTDGLEELITTAIDETTPPAGTAWTEQKGGRPVLLVALLLLLVAVAVVPRVLSRRRRRRAVTARAADPSWYQDASGDPALRLRRIIEALALALDAPGARDLPSAPEATGAIVEHTLELDRVAPRSREGLAAAGWSARRTPVHYRADDAAALLGRLVEEADRARPRVRLPRSVHAELAAQPDVAVGS
jgi:hypothetical protein